MLIPIKNRYDGSIIYSGEHDSLKKAVEFCVENKISLRGANLRHADLSNTDFSYADFSDADLRHADLSNADLRNTDLRNTDLRSTNLSYARYIGNHSTIEYTYTSWWVCTNNYYLSLGCHRFLAIDWIDNFWNNTKEFPNDNSEKTTKRVKVFYKYVSEIIKNAKENDRITPELLKLETYASSLRIEYNLEVENE